MENPIRIKAVLTKNDFIEAIRSFYAGQANNVFFGALLLLLIAAGVIGLLLNGIEPFVFLFVIMASFGLIYSYFVVPLIAANKIVRDKNWNAEYSWGATKDGITIYSGAAKGKIKWDVFQDFIDAKSFFLLIRSDNKQSFQIIPKRAFESPEHEEDFRQLLKSIFIKNQKPFVILHWRLILFVLILLIISVAYILGKNN